MSEIVRITSNNSVITFDFNNKKVAFLRSAADKIKGRQDLVLPFSEITGIEIEKASAFLMGSVCFIANDTRFSCLYDGKKHIGEALMYQCNKKEYPTLELAVSTIAFELDIKVNIKSHPTTKALDPDYMIDEHIDFHKGYNGKIIVNQVY